MGVRPVFLLPETRKQFEQRLAECPGCETYVEQIQQTFGKLQHIGKEPSSPETKQKLLQAFQRWK